MRTCKYRWPLYLNLSLTLINNITPTYDIYINNIYNIYMIHKI